MPRARIKNSRKPNKNIYIFCEGSKTEPFYFRSLIKDLAFPYGLAKVQCVDSEHTDLIGLVDDAIEHKRLYGADDDEYWVVVDKDGYSKHPEGFRKAKSGQVRVAFSSICFEFWIFLHFEFRTPLFHVCQALIDECLKDWIPRYQKKSSNIYSTVKARTKTAIDNAKRSQDRYRNTRTPICERVAYTDVDKLVSSLQSYREQLRGGFSGS